MEPTHFESLYPDTFREAEIEKLLSFIKEGNSCELVGLPGVGRSNLLGVLSYNRSIREKHLGENQKWFHFVPLNFSEVKKRPLADIWKFIFLGLADSLRERKMEEHETLNKIFKESITANDELVLFQGLKKAVDFLCIEKELTVVFLFDRFEEYLPSLTEEFFSGIRVLRNRAKYRFSCVFSLKRPLEDIVELSIFSDFHEFLAGHVIYMSLEDKAGLSFRIAYLEKASGKKIDEKIKDEVLKLTGGHGKLTRLSLENILAVSNWQLKTTKEIEEFLLEQRNIRGALFEIWNSLLPEEKQRFKNKDLSRFNRDLGFKNDFLEKVGLMGKNGITIPIFEKFISTIKESGNETIAYNPSTNTITKGETPISETLSPSEFRLLKFLIENKDRICEKEEIIKAVWKDTKSQEGVTDQALDQIVYRLRRKIEEDPNNPAHIQTIKGRGLKFSS